MALKTNTNVEKGLKLNIRRFLVLIPMFVEVPREELAGGLFAFLILNKVKKMKFSVKDFFSKFELFSWKLLIFSQNFHNEKLQFCGHEFYWVRKNVIDLLQKVLVVVQISRMHVLKRQNVI